MKRTSPPYGSTVNWFEDEAELLNAWRAFVIEIDPDIISGFNILGFDLPYILHRAHGMSERLW